MASTRPYERRWPAPAVTAVRAIRRRRMPRISSYSPRSLLELPEHIPQRAGVPAIDVHTHLGRWLTPDGRWMEDDVSRLLDAMDASNVTAAVNLDGRWGRELEDNLERYDRAHPGRFYTFCHVDWRLLGQPDGPDRLAKSLELSVAAGARGLKVWKDLGLDIEVRGRRILPDDRILAPIWEAAAATRVPVLIHVADPLAFFLPPDRHNERLEQLLSDPRGTRHQGGPAMFHRLIDSLESLISHHPRTTFIAAHAYCPHDLARVARMFERYENFYIDVAAAASDLGRQPRAARSLITEHPDRVLFGTDVFPWRAGAHETYFRLLETADEAFRYFGAGAGFSPWDLHGLDLPREVIEKVYRDNASALLGMSASRPSLPAAEPAPLRPLPDAGAAQARLRALCPVSTRAPHPLAGARPSEAATTTPGQGEPIQAHVPSRESSPQRVPRDLALPSNGR